MNKILNTNIYSLLFFATLYMSQLCKGAERFPDFFNQYDTFAHDTFNSQEACPNFSGSYVLESIKNGSEKETNINPLSYLFGAVAGSKYPYNGKILSESIIRIAQKECDKLSFEIPFEHGKEILELDLSKAYQPFTCDSTSCASFNSSWRKKIGGVSRDSSQTTIEQDENGNVSIHVSWRETWFGVPAPLPIYWATHSATMTLKRMEE